MQELVSIIIPVYNVESYLERCVESIINQTYRQLEIILVDDGSSDKSPLICDDLAKNDSRIKVVHKKNEGAGIARNTGIECAKGRFVFFVDSDDYIDCTAVEKCVRLHNENKADVIMFGRSDVYPDGRIKSKKVTTNNYYYEDDKVKNQVLRGLFTYEMGFGISVWGKLFNLDIIKLNNIRFRSEREIISEDACFILEVFSYINSVAILPESLYFYFKNDQSFSRTYKDNHQKLNDAFLDYSMEICKNNGYSDEVISYIKARYHTYALVGMKQIVGSDMQKHEKNKAMREVFNNEKLRKTLTSDVLKLAIKPSKIFWRFFKYRLYYICYLLLWYKS